MKIIFVILAALAITSSQSHASLESLLGTRVVDAKGRSIQVSTIKDKIVGLYFSASWCPPCRKFTPELVDFQNANADDFQVVFVSMDNSATAQRKYMRDYKMPWPAIPFQAGEREDLPAKFGIRGIPSLVILDSGGNLITANGREEVSSNPAGAVGRWKNASSSIPASQ